MSETNTTAQSSEQDITSELTGDIPAFLAAWDAMAPAVRNSTAMAKIIAEQIGCTHVVVLGYDAENATLQYRGAYPPVKGSKPDVRINIFNAEAESTVAQLAQGEIIAYTQLPDDSRLGSLAGFIKMDAATLVPLMANGKLIGLLGLYNQPNTPLGEIATARIRGLREMVTSLLRMVFQQVTLAEKITQIEREASIFSQIDAELNDTIEINYVFAMMKDWALRFTNADAAALALYNSDTEVLRVMSQYGFKPDAIKIDADLPKGQGGIMLRVARSGLSEIVPNVTVDNDYYALADGMLAQMSVPIKREEQVIGVLTLLSRTVNGFTDDNLDFIKRLCSRAGVAIDNARLFSETKRERGKLSHILRNIADNVILVNLDHQVEMINSAAVLAFQLSAGADYAGKSFTDVFSHANLQIAYQDAVETDEPVSTELTLPNGRTYHTSIDHHQGIGHIIVMQDITYFKETDRLKTELVATVSHDLKQPLSVMRGYLDLLKMVNDFDDKSLGYMDNLNLAFFNMRQLIDDLLDIARIEAGLQLELEDVSLTDVLHRSAKNLQQLADAKDINLILELPEMLPVISGDPKRLEQVFNNLISNGIKYTAPEGTVNINLEVRQNAVRVFVKDNGMGIGAEDQAKIFERFYRVRRPETDSIEGTGLGLAIVKSLVDAHEGKIDLKSVLGEGSTFRVTIPVKQ